MFSRCPSPCLASGTRPNPAVSSSRVQHSSVHLHEVHELTPTLEHVEHQGTTLYRRRAAHRPMQRCSSFKPLPPTPSAPSSDLRKTKWIHRSLSCPRSFRVHPRSGLSRAAGRPKDAFLRSCDGPHSILSLHALDLRETNVARRLPPLPIFLCTSHPRRSPLSSPRKS